MRAKLIMTLVFQKQLLQGSREQFRGQEEVCQEVEDGCGEGQTEAGVQHALSRLVLKLEEAL